MLRNSIIILIFLLAVPAIAGDPVDSNDLYVTPAGDVQYDCAYAELHPACSWCWTNCVFAIIADLWTGGGGWDGGDDW